MSVRLSEDMARWVLRKSVTTRGGCEAELLRKLIRAAMDNGAATVDTVNEKEKPRPPHTNEK